MLSGTKDIFCGFFDSDFIMRGKSRSEPRLVTDFELELFAPPAVGATPGTSVIDHHPYPIRTGMLLCAHPGQVRFSHLPVRCHYIRLYATESPEARQLATLPTVLPLSPAAVAELLPLFGALADCLQGHTDKQAQLWRLNALFWELLCRIRTLLPEETSDDSTADPARREVRQVRDYLERHLAEPCRLSVLGELVHLSPSYLHKLFRKTYGISPEGYLTKKRIETACRMLESGTLSIMEIAMHLGFSSQSHFGRVFKQQTGMTPAAWRRKTAEKYENTAP